MTAQDVHDLAEALHALLPMTTLTAAPWEPEQQYAVCKPGSPPPRARRPASRRSWPP